MPLEKNQGAFLLFSLSCGGGTDKIVAIVGDNAFLSLFVQVIALYRYSRKVHKLCAAYLAEPAAYCIYAAAYHGKLIFAYRSPLKTYVVYMCCEFSCKIVQNFRSNTDVFQGNFGQYDG